MSETFPLLFEGGVAGPLYNYDTDAYTGRGGWLERLTAMVPVWSEEPATRSDCHLSIAE